MRYNFQKRLTAINQIVFISLLCVLFIGATVSADVVAYDSFDYELGQISNNSGGTGWTDAWWSASTAYGQVVEQTLSYTNGDISLSNSASGKALSTPKVTVDSAISRAFTPQSGDLYCSVLLKVDIADTNSWYTQLWLTDVNYSASAPALVNSANGALGARINSRTAYVSGANTNDGETHLLVFRISKIDASDTYNRVDMYYDPDSMTLPVTSNAGVTDNTLTMTSINRLGFRLNSVGGGDVNSNLYWGEMRISDSWSSAVVPEPCSMTLVVIGGSLLFVRRRQK